MSFLVKDDELLKNHKKIWGKVNNIVIKGFEIKPVYNTKYLKTKIKYYKGNMNTKFHDNKMPTEGSHCIFFSNISNTWVKTITSNIFRRMGIHYQQSLTITLKFVLINLSKRIVMIEHLMKKIIKMT